MLTLLFRYSVQMFLSFEVKFKIFQFSTKHSAEKQLIFTDTDWNLIVKQYELKNNIYIYIYIYISDLWHLIHKAIIEVI